MHPITSNSRESKGEIQGHESESEIVVSSLVPQPLKNRSVRTDGYVYFQTVRCKLIGKDQIVKVRLLLDTAAQRSFIRRDLSRGLELEVTGRETLKIHSFAGNLVFDFTFLFKSFD